MTILPVLPARHALPRPPFFFFPFLGDDACNHRNLSQSPHDPPPPGLFIAWHSRGVRVIYGFRWVYGGFYFRTRYRLLYGLVPRPGQCSIECSRCYHKHHFASFVFPPIFSSSRGGGCVCLPRVCSTKCCMASLPTLAPLFIGASRIEIERLPNGDAWHQAKMEQTACLSRQKPATPRAVRWPYLSVVFGCQLGHQATFIPPPSVLGQDPVHQVGKLLRLGQGRL